MPHSNPHNDGSKNQITGRSLF